MDKVSFPTRFNKTGRRTLTPPIDGTKLLAPASRTRRDALRDARVTQREAWEKARQECNESLADSITRLATSNEVPRPDRVRLIHVMASHWLMGTSAHMPDGVKIRLPRVPGLDEAEKRASYILRKKVREADEEKEVARREAEATFSSMADELRAEYRAGYA